MPARLLWKWECMSTASFVAISNAPHNSPCGKSIRSFANWSTTAISSTSEPRSQKMNLIELNRALGQLRLGGIAAVLETRLHQAQAEAMPPIDFLSCLVSDELTRRGDRLLERRTKQAEFRDPQRSLDNFDFNGFGVTIEGECCALMQRRTQEWQGDIMEALCTIAHISGFAERRPKAMDTEF